MDPADTGSEMTTGERVLATMGDSGVQFSVTTHCATSSFRVGQVGAWSLGQVGNSQLSPPTAGP